MKNLICLTLALFFAFNLNAQSRENTAKFLFSSKSKKLIQAEGWAQNKETGKWIKNKNVIDDKIVPSYWISHISQNFKWIQFATIINGGKTFYVLLNECVSGEFRYPNIQKDWESDKRTYYFVLTSEQYEDLRKQIDIKSATDIKITSYSSGYMSDRFKILGGENLYSEDNLLAKITNSIEKPDHFGNCLILNSQIVDGKDVVRFKLPEDCRNDDFKTNYFEVNVIEFKTIFL